MQFLIFPRFESIYGIVITTVVIFSLTISVTIGQSIDYEQDSIKIKSLLDKSQTETDSATFHKYLDSAYLLSENAQYLSGIINVKNTRSTFFLKQGNAVVALDILEEILDLPLTDRYDRLLATTYNNIGLAYYQLGSADKAIEWHQKAVSMSEKINSVMGLARGYNNLGICYQKIENWEKALYNHKKSLAICEQEGIKPGIAYNLGNIGIIQNNLNQFDSALLSHERSLRMNKALGDRYQEAINHNNIAVVFESLNMSDSAEYYHLQALKVREIIHDKIGIMSSLNDLSLLQMDENKNLDQAKQRLAKALEIALEIKAKDYLRETYLNLARLYEQTGQIGLSLNNRKLYEQWKDSTVSESHLNRISELELKYESQKKENEILVLSQANIEKEASLEKQKLLLKVMVTSIVVLIIVIILLIIIFKQSSVNKTKQQLLRAVNETQEKERSRVARDLHDSVGIMLTAIKHKVEQTQADGKIKNLVDEAVTEVRRIAHNMMPGALLKYGLNSAVEQLISNVEQTEKIKVTLYTYGLDERLNVNLEIAVYRIIQELTQNIIKHAMATEMVLHINKHKDHLNIIMEDNGKGFKNDFNNKLDEGIGLKNIKSRIATWNGDITIDSKKPSGTIVLVNIPLNDD